jgi:hypothetical protein
MPVAKWSARSGGSDVSMPASGNGPLQLVCASWPDESPAKVIELTPNLEFASPSSRALARS